MSTESNESVALAPGGRAALFVISAAVVALPLASGNLSTYGVSGPPVLYDSVALPRLVIALVAVLLAGALHALGDRGATLMRHPSVLVLGGVAVLATLSAALSDDPLFGVLGQSERLEGLVTWWLYVACALVALQVVRVRRDLRGLAAALVSGAAIVSAYGVLQFLGFDWADRSIEMPGFEVRRAFATFGNPNFLAALLVLALPVATGLALGARRSVAWAAWWTASGLIAAALLATFTRGAWLAGVIGMAAFVWALGSNAIRVAGRSRLAIGLVGAALAVVIAISLASSGEVNIIERLTVGASTGERVLTLQAGFAAAAERPMLGWGPDRFLAAFRQVRPDRYAEQFGTIATINNAHSWPVQAAATLGIPAALLFLGALVWPIAATVRLLPRRRAAETVDTLYAGVWAGCLGFVVCMMFNVAALAATVPFFLMLGALMVPIATGARHASNDDAARRPALWARSTGIGLAVATVAALVWGVTLLAADHSYVASRLAYAGAVEADAVPGAARAVRLNPVSVKYARGLAEAHAKHYYDLVDKTGRPGPEARAAWQEADRAFLAVESRHGGDYATLAWHAALVASEGAARGDARLLARSRAIARKAAALDRHPTQVMGLAGTSDDPDAVTSARSVPRLP